MTSRARGVLLAILFILPATVTGTADPTTPDGDGLSAFVALAQAEGAQVQTTVASPLILDGQEAQTVLVVVAPHRGFSASEREAIGGFVEAGGRLLLADDLGPGGELAAEFGIQYDRVHVYGSDPDGPSDEGIDEVRANASLGGSTFELVLDLPSSLAVLGSSTRNTTTIARTEEASFADFDGDRRISADDLSGRMPVAYGVQDAQGQLRAVFLGDSGLLLNGFLDEGDNRPFARALLAELLPDGGRVVIDTSRHQGPAGRAASAPLNALLVATTVDPYRILLVSGTLVLAAVAVWRLREEDAWAPHVHDPDRVIPRADDEDLDPGTIREILLDDLDPELRKAVEDGGAAPARLAQAVGDKDVARLLAGEDVSVTPGTLEAVLDRFDDAAKRGERR